MTVIKMKKVTKNFGSKIALSDINLEIGRGKIVGLIGQNGAGKTTLLKSILGLTHYSGELTVLGMHPRKDRVALMNRVCFIADVAIMPRWLKVKNALEFMSGIHPKFDRNKAIKLIIANNINLESKVGTLSKGMIVQLHLALVLAIDVEILVLDEPTLGLDILSRSKFYQSILSDFFAKDRTIIITTHQVEEIQNILTDLVIINRGQIVLQSEMDALASRYIEVSAKPENLAELEGLLPLYQKNEIGRIKLIFEGKTRDELQQYGELSNPSVSDIFLAKIGENKNA